MWIKKWDNFKVFYSNLILNLLVDYNDIKNIIDGYKIIFDDKSKQIYLNPGNF